MIWFFFFGLVWLMNPGKFLKIGVQIFWTPSDNRAGSCNNRGPTWLKLAIVVTAKTFFERLYLIPGMGTFGPRVNCPYAPTTPTVQ